MHNRNTLILTFLAVIGLSFAGQAQWSDDFSTNTLDGTTWTGDLVDFVINDDKELQLMADDGGVSNLYQTLTFVDEQVWSFKMNMDFAPSTSNKTRFYLMAKSVIGIVTDGIYLEMGESGTDDAIQFYKREAGVDALLMSGTLGGIASQPVDIAIKVERRNGNLWRLLVDYTGDGVYSFEGEVVDAFYPKDTAEGLNIELEYTATRTDKFYFDDFLVEEYTPDVFGPEIAGLTVEDATHLLVVFNEPLTTLSLNTNQFSITGGEEPINVEVVNPTTLRLTFANDFTSGVNLDLTISNVSDLEGNVSASLTDSFLYEIFVVAEDFDIIINEIMADPSPPLALPECEYVELYNTTNVAFNLEGYTLNSGGTPQALPSFILEPGAYVVVTDLDCEGLFDADIDVITLNSFPALSNSGDIIVLANNLGFIINNVTYTANFYGDPAKDDGGWSLELINPNQPCLIEGNWTASNSLQGGTPGKENSVIENEQDLDGPLLVSIFPISTNELEVTFSELLTPLSIPDVDAYALSGGIEVIAANLLPQSNKISLLLDMDLEVGQTYTLDVLSFVMDCVGNEIESTSLDFGLPAIPENGDIFINELLFDPYSGGSEFIEFYNHSDKVIDLFDMIFVANDNVRSLPHYLLVPQSYVALSTNTLNVKDTYTIENENAIITGDLPSFTNDEGKIRLYTKESPSIMVDSFHYDDNMHLTFIQSTKGVSLERSSFSLTTNDPNNWHSASTDIGYATPGYQNSQFVDGTSVSSDQFSTRHHSFSPNQDGYRDFLIIDYAFDEPDNIVSLSIYDANGYLVKSFDENMSLAQTGFITWDGLDDDQLNFPAGIYIVKIDGVNLTSNQSFKEIISFVLALPYK